MPKRNLGERRLLNFVTMGVVGVGVGLYGRDVVTWFSEQLEGGEDAPGEDAADGAGPLSGFAEFVSLAKDVTFWGLCTATARLVSKALGVVVASYSVFIAGVVWYERKDAFAEAKDLVAAGGDDSTGVSIAVEPWGLAVRPNAVKKQSKLGVIYFPGALVDEVAYAPVAAKLAAKMKAPVCVIKVPLRLATVFPRAARARAKAARAFVVDAAAAAAAETSTTTTTTEAGTAPKPPVSMRWVYGGHSLGGFAAAAALRVKDADAVGLLLHASLCELADVPEAIKILQIVAERDTIVPASKALEPDDGGRVTVKVIKGGNHAGFAHYGPQRFPRRDGARAITLDDQIDQVVQATSKWAVGPPSQKGGLLAASGTNNNNGSSAQPAE